MVWVLLAASWAIAGGKLLVRSCGYQSDKNSHSCTLPGAEMERERGEREMGRGNEEIASRSNGTEVVREAMAITHFIVTDVACTGKINFFRAATGG